MKIRIKCKKCNWTAEVDVQPSPLGAMQPNDQAKGAGIKIKWSKDQLDKIMETAGKLGASREELEQLGLKIKIPEWKEAEERARLRRFIKEHLRISKEERKSEGEKSQVSTEPWVMGDSFKDVDLASSEVKSMGVDDLRMIPGVTLQKRIYEDVKGKDREVLKGIKFFNIVDVSGSMFGGAALGKIEKVHKALMMAEETWKICKALGYDYNLAIFSDRAARIPKNRISTFFKDEQERSKYGCWNGGTVLSSALELYDLKELKDANLVIMSDMDIYDLEDTKKKLYQIGNVTNSFKIVLIERESSLDKGRIERTQDLFPDKKVEILKISM